MGIRKANDNKLTTNDMCNYRTIRTISDDTQGGQDSNYQHPGQTISS